MMAHWQIVKHKNCIFFKLGFVSIFSVTFYNVYAQQPKELKENSHLPCLFVSLHPNILTWLFRSQKWRRRCRLCGIAYSERKKAQCTRKIKRSRPRDYLGYRKECPLALFEHFILKVYRDPELTDVQHHAIWRPLTIW
jgi:hypothetical protein